MKNIWMQLLLILVAAAVLGFASNAVNPNKIAIQMQRPEIKVADDAVVREATDLSGPVTINKTQVQKLLKADALLLDARVPDEFAAGHIDGAQNIPYELLGDYVEQIDTLPHDVWVITYCDGPPCEKSVLLADELFNMGFSRVAVYYAGLDDWNKAEEEQ